MWTYLDWHQEEAVCRILHPSLVQVHHFLWYVEGVAKAFEDESQVQLERLALQEP